MPTHEGIPLHTDACDCGHEHEHDLDDYSDRVIPQFNPHPVKPVKGNGKGPGFEPVIGTQLPPSKWAPDPREHPDRARTLILCFDGTGDQFDDDNSNVVQFFSALKKDNSEQLVYYQTGIGTYSSKSFITPLFNQLSSIFDEMFAWNLSAHVMDGYEFLMQNYKEGDRISIFGFSRGAYTARALAGMVQKVGLLPVSNIQQVPFAWQWYTNQSLDPKDIVIAHGFKRTFSIDVPIDFVGVWDTVASVGIVSKELPFVANNKSIRVFRHAVALDEHRAKFMPNFYNQSENEPYTIVPVHPVSHAYESSSATLVENDNGTEPDWTQTDADEVWFAGCHCDVGGGSVSNDTRYSLARIPLRWMIRECFRTKTGIIFDKVMLKSFGLDPGSVYPKVKARGPRKSPRAGMKLAEPEEQGFGITTAISLITQLLWLPFNIFLTYLFAPLKSFVLLLRYTPPVRWLFRKLHIAPPPEYIPPTIQVPVRTPECIASEVDDEEEEELNDAISPEYDQLAARWFWWVIEFIPMRFRDQQGHREDFYVALNRGRGRKIYGDAMEGGLRIHRSVKTRLEVLKNGKPMYTPRAWWTRRETPDGPKVKGPERWDVANPDPNREWTWVGENEEDEQDLIKFKP